MSWIALPIGFIAVKFAFFNALISNLCFFNQQTQFVVDEVSNIIKESIESTIGGNGYAHSKGGQWTNSVVESCLASLTKLQKPFKYIGESRQIQSYNYYLLVSRND